MEKEERKENLDEMGGKSSRIQKRLGEEKKIERLKM